MVPSSLDGVELGAAVVEACADDKAIVVSEDLGRGRRLDRAAEAVGRGRGAVDLAQDAVGQHAGRGNRQAIEPDEIRQIALQDRESTESSDRGIRILRVGPVAIDVALPETAVVGVSLERKSIDRIPAGARSEKGQLILRRLRKRVGACPVPVEQLDRGCGGGAKVVGRAGECDVELGLIAARAEVGVDAAQPRRRVVAPAIVVDGIGGEIARQVSGLPSRLHHGSAPSERAAAQFRVGALVGESVLHLDGQCAAQRVEPVYRVAGHERHAIDGGFRNEVPVDDVAKKLVDAHAVLIDGQALRRADRRARR